MMRRVVKVPAPVEVQDNGEVKDHGITLVPNNPYAPKDITEEPEMTEANSDDAFDAETEESVEVVEETKEEVTVAVEPTKIKIEEKKEKKMSTVNPLAGISKEQQLANLRKGQETAAANRAAGKHTYAAKTFSSFAPEIKKQVVTETVTVKKGITLQDTYSLNSILKNYVGQENPLITNDDAERILKLASATLMDALKETSIKIKNGEESFTITNKYNKPRQNPIAGTIPGGRYLSVNHRLTTDAE